MSITTYAQLQTTIATWLRPGTASTSGLQITDFITLFENKANRRLRLRVMESDESVVGVVSSRYVALPSGYLEPIALYLTDEDPREELDYRLPEQLCVLNQNNRPQEWAIDGTNIAFDVPCDQAYTMTFRMYERFALSDSATTNWLLTNHPDLYLYGSLVNAAPYVRDSEMLPVWKTLVEEGMAELEHRESSIRGKAPLRTDLGSRRSNILRG